MILVLGSKGMLGHKMVEHLQHDLMGVVGASREDFDATDVNSTFALLNKHRPDVIINCVGAIKQRTTEQKEMYRINGGLPNLLERWCHHYDSYLFHFSTDCVFSGRKGGYSEMDTPDPVDDYGASKALGELKNSEHSVTFRTSIIGREKENYLGLLEWFLRQTGEVQGHENAIFSGVTTNWLADVVSHLIASDTRLYGLYQVAAPPVSKFELLKIFEKVYHTKTSIVPVSEPRCDRSLIGKKFESVTKIGVPALETMVLLQRNQDWGKYAV